MKSFEKLTVGEYQQLYEIHISGDDQIEKSVASVAVLTGKPRWEVEDMDFDQFREKAREATVLFSAALVEKFPSKLIKIAGKWYRVCLNPRKLTAGQYIDLQVFLKENQIRSLHKIMACLLIPVKRYGLYTKVGKYDGENHEKIAEGIQDCNFMQVHSTCVFFLRLWNLSIKAMVPFLKKELSKTGMKTTETTLQGIMDGFLMQRV